MTKTTRIVNQFHGTETRVRAGLGGAGIPGYSILGEYGRPCAGMADCCCGDSSGARGSYYTLYPIAGGLDCVKSAELKGDHTTR